MRLIDADALKETIPTTSVDMFGNCRNCSLLSEEQVNELIDMTPTVNSWIPCSERLPENNDPVNVTWVNRNPEVYYMDIKDKPFTATAIYFRGKWFWYSCVIEDWLKEYGSNESFLANLQEAVDRDIEITAWMPLPKPWKGEEK